MYSITINNNIYIVDGDQLIPIENTITHRIYVENSFNCPEIQLAYFDTGLINKSTKNHGY